MTDISLKQGSLFYNFLYFGLNWIFYNKEI
ncbi:MAG: hypothetical protein JWP44_2454 [Mucilaginibacter sp.]|nr:hypothetical protein [Mucilaginibacter sp.]